MTTSEKNAIARLRAEHQAEDERAEAREKDLVRRLAKHDGRLLEAKQKEVNLPPESATDKRIRELEERVARSEGKAPTAAPYEAYKADPKRRVLAEELRIVRQERQSGVDSLRHREHELAVCKHSDALERIVA